MYDFKKAFLHTKTVLAHKKEVMRLASYAGISWQGLTHDLSKFCPSEFLESVKYCNGIESPIRTCRKETGKSEAWLYHKSKNKHHWEWWVDDLVHGGKGVAMPYKYALEMAIDIIAANRVYAKDEWTPDMLKNYWAEHRKEIIVHHQTLRFLDSIFRDYIQFGVAALDPDKTIVKYNISMNIEKRREIIRNRKTKYITIPAQ